MIGVPVRVAAMDIHRRAGPMQSVRQIAEEIVAREGGYVDDPDDPGGATRYGVTLATLVRLGLDPDHDGAIDARDVRALTRDQAIDIFIRHYFDAPRLQSLPEPLQPSVFDMYVNAGANAIRILQRLLVAMGEAVSVDGIVGPQTIAAAGSAQAGAAGYLADAYAIARRNYYFRLADRRPGLRKFAQTRAGGKGGWIRRAEAFMAPHYRLSEAAFERRVSGWA